MQQIVARAAAAGAVCIACRDGLRDNAGTPAMERFEGIFRGIGKTREGDAIALDFTARGLAVAVNGEPRGEVPDAAFARALPRVWLGDHPVDAALKRALLRQ